MSKKALPPGSAGHWPRRWVLPITLVGSLLILLWLRWPGLILIALILGITYVMLRFRPDVSETTALRSSVVLSAEDINDILQEFDEFSDSPDPDALADRTLHRPALLDLDCSDPDIEAFHYQYSTAQRFLNRLDARLANPELDVTQLENLLSVTDRRALELRDSWLAARQAARRLGPGESGS